MLLHGDRFSWFGTLDLDLLVFVIDRCVYQMVGERRPCKHMWNGEMEVECLLCDDAEEKSTHTSTDKRTQVNVKIERIKPHHLTPLANTSVPCLVFVSIRTYSLEQSLKELSTTLDFNNSRSLQCFLFTLRLDLFVHVQTQTVIDFCVKISFFIHFHKRITLILFISTFSLK